MLLKSVPHSALILLLTISSFASACSANPGSIFPSQQDAKDAVLAAEASSQEAFLQIKEANLEGGNVSALAERFNMALELLDEAGRLLDDLLYDQALTLAQEAQQLFRAISTDALSLQKRAAEEASNRRMLALLSAPIATILLTLISYFLIRFWQKRSVRRIMEMKVEEVELQ